LQGNYNYECQLDSHITSAMMKHLHIARSGQIREMEKHNKTEKKDKESKEV